jgi:hypothetical protein
MDSISVLRYCASVLLVREVTDVDRRWQWVIRRKVVNWALSRAARTGVPADSDVLSDADRQQIDATHPWLQPIMPIVLPTRRSNEPAKVAIAQRVERYVAALRQRAAGLIPAEVMRTGEKLVRPFPMK